MGGNSDSKKLLSKNHGQSGDNSYKKRYMKHDDSTAFKKGCLNTQWSDVSSVRLLHVYLQCQCFLSFEAEEDNARSESTDL